MDLLRFVSLATLLVPVVLLGAFSNAFQEVLVTTKTNLSPALPNGRTLPTSTLFAQNDANEENGRGLKFFEGLKDAFDNFDDIIDDFLYKRMGNGEQFYGKRKYNPSGKFDGQYQGMGRSDQSRIEMALVQKELMEERRSKRQAEEEEEEAQNRANRKY
jgi:hypothetical protein